jgi:hypothetical protein
MTLITDLFPELTPKAVIRFPNLSGAIVTVGSLREGSVTRDERLIYGARCAGCLDAYDHGHYLPAINDPRAWAAKHSAACRALPQPETATQNGENQ